MIAALEQDADGTGDDEGDRDGDDEVPPEEAGRQRRAEDFLHDIGGIGAEHDHLAMRHVDDPHHAEGDGEADRGEQQHAAEADALEEVEAEADIELPALERGERGCGGVAHFGVGAGAAASGPGASRPSGSFEPARPAIAAMRCLRRAGIEADAEEARLHHTAQLRILLGGERLLERLGRLGRAVLQRVARRRQPVVAIGAEQHEAARAPRRSRRAGGC